MSEIVVQAAQQVGERDGPEGLYLTAVRLEGERLDALLVELQHLAPDELPPLEVEAKLRTAVGLVNGFEGRYPAALSRWARGERLSLRAEADRLMSGVLIFPPEWRPLV